MQVMVISRRLLLKSGLGVLGGAALERLAAPAAVSAAMQQPLFAAARRNADGGYSAVLFTKDKDLSVVPLPERGHDAAVRPGGAEVVVFARRPGRFAVVFSPDKNKPPFMFHAPEHRHFYGHGVFSRDGRLLYTSENDFENGTGIIGVFEAGGAYRRIGEFSAFGVGPHDLALMKDGQTLVVANGGLETHPAHGRHILNLAEMAPSLVYIDVRTGDLIEKVQLPHDLHQLSIRHLAIGAGGRVLFGCQYKGPAGDPPPLMAFHDRGKEIQVMNGPDHLLKSLNNYIGSVAVDRSGGVVAASAPRGNLVTFWQVADGKFLGARQLKDGCGVAATGTERQFLLTSGHGALATETLSDRGVQPEGVLARQSEAVAFDNHAVFVGWSET